MLRSVKVAVSIILMIFVADKDPSVLTSRSCVTPESWQRMFNQMAQQPGFTSDMNRTSNGYTFSANC